MYVAQFRKAHGRDLGACVGVTYVDDGEAVRASALQPDEEQAVARLNVLRRTELVGRR